MKDFLKGSKRIFNQNLLFNSNKRFSDKIYRHITPKNTQEYHDKKQYENFKDNVIFSLY